MDRSNQNRNNYRLYLNRPSNFWSVLAVFRERGKQQLHIRIACVLITYNNINLRKDFYTLILTFRKVSFDTFLHFCRRILKYLSFGRRGLWKRKKKNVMKMFKNAKLMTNNELNIFKYTIRNKFYYEKKRKNIYIIVQI